MNFLQSFITLAETAADNVFTAAQGLYIGIGLILIGMSMSSIAEGIFSIANE